MLNTTITSNIKQHKHLFTLLICLYFSQGLPSGLMAHALPALMRSYHVSLEWISMLKLLAIPWFLKFLWAPCIDQYWQRKNWIILFQSIVILLLGILSFMEPASIFSSYLIPFLVLLFLLNLCSASQDIASDGLAIQKLPAEDLGIANSIQVGAYKVGLIGGGTLLLVLLDFWGWQYSFRVFAGLLIICLLPVIFLGNRNHRTALHAESNNKTHYSLRQTFLGFIKTPGMGIWLCIIACYKMADGLGSGMIKPMLIDQGYSLATIGYLTTISSLSGIVGATLSGFLFFKIPLRSALAGFGALQAVAIGLLAYIPQVAHSTTLVYSLIIFEQFADGMSTVAIFAAMMMHCRTDLEGTDYTLQNSIHLTGAGTVSLASGFIAEAFGYPLVFFISCLLGFLTLLLVITFNSSAAIKPTIKL